MNIDSEGSIYAGIVSTTIGYWVLAKFNPTTSIDAEWMLQFDLGSSNVISTALMPDNLSIAVGGIIYDSVMSTMYKSLV